MDTGDDHIGMGDDGIDMEDDHIDTGYIVILHLGSAWGQPAPLCHICHARMQQSGPSR